MTKYIWWQIIFKLHGKSMEETLIKIIMENGWKVFFTDSEHVGMGEMLPTPPPSPKKNVAPPS